MTHHYRYTCMCSNLSCKHPSHEERRVKTNETTGYSMSVKSMDKEALQLIHNGNEEHLFAKAGTKYELHLHNNTEHHTYITPIISSTTLGTWCVEPHTTLRIKKCYDNELRFDSTFLHVKDLTETRECVHSSITAIFHPKWSNSCRQEEHDIVTLRLPVTVCSGGFGVRV